MNSLCSDSTRGRREGTGVRRLLLPFIGILFFLVLFFFDPATAGFYPPCLFKTVLGAQCPGCGSLRAAHQLLHGNFAAAWALNPTLMIVGPLAAALTLFNLLRKSSSSSSSSRST